MLAVYTVPYENGSREGLIYIYIIYNKIVK